MVETLEHSVAAKSWLCCPKVVNKCHQGRYTMNEGKTFKMGQLWTRPELLRLRSQLYGKPAWLLIFLTCSSLSFLVLMALVLSQISQQSCPVKRSMGCLRKLWKRKTNQLGLQRRWGRRQSQRYGIRPRHERWSRAKGWLNHNWKW